MGKDEFKDGMYALRVRCVGRPRRVRSVVNTTYIVVKLEDDQNRDTRPP